MNGAMDRALAVIMAPLHAINEFVARGMSEVLCKRPL